MIWIRILCWRFIRKRWIWPCLGSYQAVYTAKDRSGNQAEIVQNITVEANPEWDAEDRLSHLR